MEIRPQEFRIDCNLEEINIIHKALSVLRDDVILKKKGYGKVYLEKVKQIMEKTREYW